jgi:hypothetical protein
MKSLFFLYLTLSALLLSSQSDTMLISSHLDSIIKTDGYRNYRNTVALNKTAAYIHRVLSSYADTVFYQNYPVKNIEYRNVICRFGPAGKPVIVVGAHYDVCGNQDGADDNASGVVALLELARMLKGKELKYQVEIVAYSLEEPPYFETEFMGSYVHAKSLYDSKTPVYGMICFDMIGYFSNEKNSQTYPLRILKLFYGNKGDFITAVNTFGKGRFARRFTRKFRKTDEISVKKITAPNALVGVDLSDHQNYWKFGYSATFITNTAFYRNKNYHQISDTKETIDIIKMAYVIDGVFRALTRVK